MNTHNVNTAAQEPSERWGKRLMARFRTAVDEAEFNAACGEESHRHYGVKFSAFDNVWYLFQGFKNGLLRPRQVPADKTAHHGN